MTPQEELKQIYKEGIEIDLREGGRFTEEYENFNIEYMVSNGCIYIDYIIDDNNHGVFTHNTIDDLEYFLTEFNQKDWDISDAEEFGNINY